jgi:DNA-binding MarR family transcriptional regulator
MECFGERTDMDAASIRFESPELIPGEILRRRDLNLAAKRVYSLIRYCQGQERSCRLAMSWMASRLNLSRQAVGRAVGQLNDRKLLTIKQQPRKLSIFSIKQIPLKKFFLPLYSGQTRQDRKSVV